MKRIKVHRKAEVLCNYKVMKNIKIHGKAVIYCHYKENKEQFLHIHAHKQRMLHKQRIEAEEEKEKMYRNFKV